MKGEYYDKTQVWIVALFMLAMGLIIGGSFESSIADPDVYCATEE